MLASPALDALASRPRLRAGRCSRSARALRNPRRPRQVVRRTAPFPPLSASPFAAFPSAFGFSGVETGGAISVIGWVRGGDRALPAAVEAPPVVARAEPGRAVVVAHAARARVHAEALGAALDGAGGGRDRRIACVRRRSAATRRRDPPSRRMRAPNRARRRRTRPCVGSTRDTSPSPCTRPCGRSTTRRGRSTDPQRSRGNTRARRPPPGRTPCRTRRRLGWRGRRIACFVGRWADAHHPSPSPPSVRALLLCCCRRRHRQSFRGRAPRARPHRGTRARTRPANPWRRS